MKKIYRTGLYVHYVPDAFEEEKHYSPKRQLRTLHSYIARDENLIPVKEYIDLDGEADKQKVFKEMIDDIYNGQIDCVIVRSISLIGSHYYHGIDFVKKFCAYMELRVIAVRDNYDSNKDHVWNRRKLDQIMDEFHKRHIKEVVFNSRNRHWKNGEFNLGPVPYGYFRVAGHLYIDKDVEVVVRSIFQRYADGDTPYEIARDLREMNLMSPREYLFYMKYGELSGRYEWDSSTVFRMLRNRFYVGDTVHRRFRKTIEDEMPSDTLPPEEWLIVDDTHEAIISDALFKRVQDRIKQISEKKIPFCDHSSNYYGPAKNYLRDKIFCGKCGSTCNFRHQTSYAGYICADKKHVKQNNCEGLSIPLGVVNKAILDVLRLRYDIRDDHVTKMLVDRRIKRVVVYEGKIVYVEVKEKRGER